MSSENPRYECLCVKCNKTFFAPSKRALICLSCKAPDEATGTGDDRLDGDPDDWRKALERF